MRRIKWGWIWAVLLGIALLALIGWRVVNRAQTRGGSSAVGRGTAGRRTAPSVEVAEAKPADLVTTIQSVGNIESPQRVSITPRVSGRIEHLQVREGDAVRKDEVIVRLDPSELQASSAQQEAAVAQARSRLAEAQLGQGSAQVSVTSQIAQQSAAVASALADLRRVRETQEGQIATAQASVANAEARLRSAQSAVLNAQAEVAQERSNLQNAQRRLSRAETLFAQGAISAQQRDDAETVVEVQEQAIRVAEGRVDAARANAQAAESELRGAQSQLNIAKRQSSADLASAEARAAQARAGLDVAQANRSQNPAYAENLAALRAAVRAAEAQLQAARARLRDTVIRSPLNGYVTARNANPGEVASPGNSLLTLESLDSVYATTAIPIESAAGVKVGMTAEITVDAYKGRTFTGTVSHINPAADRQSRQIGLRILLQNADRLLKPGMYAKVAVVASRARALVAVPAEAVRRARDETTVTVVSKEGVADVREVVTGASNGAFVEILKGVEAGEQVVTLSYSPIQDEQKVTLPSTEEAEGKRGGRRSQEPQRASQGRTK